MDTEFKFEPLVGDEASPPGHNHEAAPGGSLRRPFPRAGFAVVTAIAALFLIPCVAYWISSRTNVALCLFGNAACSVTFGVYLLCIISAFILVTLIWLGRE